MLSQQKVTPVQEPDAKKTRIISVGGGKGGVGKSIVSVNLAATFARQGHAVVLADMDLGTANQHLLLGIDEPKSGLKALLDHTINDATDGLTETGIPNLKLLAGLGSTMGAANITHSQKLRIIRKLRRLEADIVVVDVGAGVGYNALDFFELGGQKVVVATPQITSIHDAYAFLKSAVLRSVSRQAEKSARQALVDAVNAADESEKVVDILAFLEPEFPDFVAQVRLMLRGFSGYFMGNQVHDQKQSGVFHSVSRMMEDYLGISVPVLGWLQATNAVHESVNRRRPLILGPITEETRLLDRIADTLAFDDVPLDLDLEEEIELLEDVEDDVLGTVPLDPSLAGVEMPEADSTFFGLKAAQGRTSGTTDKPGQNTDPKPTNDATEEGASQDDGTLSALDKAPANDFQPRVYTRPPRKKRRTSNPMNRRPTLPGLTPYRPAPDQV